MTAWRKNEPTAVKRQCALQVFKDDGTPAWRGLDFVALGITWVRGANSPNADAATGTLTNERRPLAGVAIVVTATASSDQINHVAHGLETGDGPFNFANTGGALPGNIVAAPTAYYVIKVDADNFKIANSALGLTNVYAAVPTIIDITSNGTGTTTMSSAVGCGRGMDGRFVYQAPQAETNHNGAEMEIVVDDGGAGNYALKNGAGGSAYVAMTEGGAWDEICEGSVTYGDAQRLQNSILAGPVLDFTTNTLVFKSLDGTKTRWTVTVSAAGRLTVTPGDLT